MFYLIARPLLQSPAAVGEELKSEPAALKAAAEYFASTNIPVDVCEVISRTEVAGLITAASIPVALTDAIRRWNDVAVFAKVPRVKLETAKRYLHPWRRWKTKTNAEIDLDEIIDLVAGQPFTWDWIHFGWLFGSKSGTLNSEKIVSGQFKKNPSPNRPSEPAERFDV